MYIIVIYKDEPELSTYRRTSSEVDLSVEKILLVNPHCPVRIMLEYIRTTCRLGKFTKFDLCDESGVLMGLFSMPTYTYATDHFVHKKTYYIIVMKQEADKSTSVLPQLNRGNSIYEDLKSRVLYYLTTGETSPPLLQSATRNTSATKTGAKKKY